MKHLSHMNPSKRKFPSATPVGSSVRGVTAEKRADTNVSAVIWGITAFLFLFVCLTGDRWMVVISVFGLPIAAAVSVTLSKMGESPVWAWTMTVLHCVLGFLWVFCSVAS